MCKGSSKDRCRPEGERTRALEGDAAAVVVLEVEEEADADEEEEEDEEDEAGDEAEVAVAGVRCAVLEVPCFLSSTGSSKRHVGQELCSSSQGIRQRRWNLCRQGIWTTVSPAV